ncbi:MAG: 1,4-alpha-glucan branching enzyme, partial [Phycisphaeraceae bacterium]
MGDRLGAHLGEQAGVQGVHFAVWAPNAREVRVVGDFNGWDRNSPDGRLTSRATSGIWEGFIPGVESGASYKYHVVPADGSLAVDKADPYAVHAETPPHTASKV